ncbi:hypothetical protein A4D02_33915 [Niastella koreensis]|uniref:Lipocalin-like domain-containing protein n=2 Tax=Niastella koreensis TaxID=354356 RepID=G8TBQ8_NIAKG|nr:lipocalin family protein [Niastella koreensis]AEV98190.1 hypothetical protein Niako_1831 [Niastella koreensis GR20-10]OQP45394.1 hypothetical protein A4D02_33915 [Niastella koreensis]
MKRVLLATAFTIVLFSCQKSKDDKPQPAQKDYEGKYKITKLVFQSTGNPDQDLLASLPDCTQDDLLVLAADSVFKTEDAGVACGDSPTDPTVWFVKENKITIDGVQSSIVSFNNHTLVLSTPMELLGVKGNILETLERQ